MKFFKSFVGVVVLCFSFNVFAQDFETRQSDFKQLYNKYRFGAPDIIPWAGTYWPYGMNGLNWDYDGNGSPAEKWDRHVGHKHKEAFSWEAEEHSCDPLPKSEQEGCKGWWGHCNAWAAAGIKEAEPRTGYKGRNGVSFTVGDIKGYLTELWMDSDSLFAGNTDKSKETKSWINNANDPSYEAFWDVSPRTFFLIFTNYIGIMKTGVVIDRFTGDQVWNQSVVGYRIIPIKKSDIKPAEEKNGRKIYPVLLTMKIYWANDGVGPDHISKPFDIKRTSDNEFDGDEKELGEHSAADGEEADYSLRVLKFFLYFDAPVELGAGNTIASAGRMVGDGVWYHKIDQNVEMDETHPDFIWLPTRLISGGGYSNPYVEASKVYKVIEGKQTGGGGRQDMDDKDQDAAQSEIYDLNIRGTLVREAGGKKAALARLVGALLKREGIKAYLSPRNIEFNGGWANIRIRVFDGTSKEEIKAILQ